MNKSEKRTVQLSDRATPRHRRAAVASVAQEWVRIRTILVTLAGLMMIFVQPAFADKFVTTDRGTKVIQKDDRIWSVAQTTNSRDDSMPLVDLVLDKKQLRGKTVTIRGYLIVCNSKYCLLKEGNYSWFIRIRTEKISRSARKRLLYSCSVLTTKSRCYVAIMGKVQRDDDGAMELSILGTVPLIEATIAAKSLDFLKK